LRRDPFWCGGVVIALAACGRPASGPVPITGAPFVAVSANSEQVPPRNECWMAGRFEGTAFVRDDGLELVIPRGWIAVTRNNDKEWDDLHLAVEVSTHAFSDARFPPLLSTMPIVLRPTVDSAGPQLTTWQSVDTLRIYVPWQHALGPRWLVFTASYSTLSHKGERGECSGRMGTDTLRFRAGP
jgi:hypothetical protein